MASVALVLLNLLIVIMGDATERVRGSSQLHAVSEKTQLLLEIDELWLPVLVSLGQTHLAHPSNFPLWLHMLVPTATEGGASSK
jgi:hypothetical protein